MLDMMKMMGKIKEAQEKMKKIKDELDTIELKSESGAGLVSVHINGKKEILSINIDKSILDEKEMLQDLVVAATNKALNDIDIKIKEHMKEKTGDILPNIPGFDMGNLFK
ncbi:MAG: DNA-binding protein [Flammeovirgaceae bacterium]|nr:DNA-binding protein [Flammeovirgaceae bacterium]|tara:strand:+ start:1370 stop:1699 length:330 start_codon:yes stop_codon:yes gene_type:complete